ncbi:MAG: OadG family transporter subunit [Bacteroidota bacterium]
MNTIMLEISSINMENVTIALVGYLIVFSALVLLYFVFNSLPKLIHFQARIRLKKKGQTEIAQKKDLSIPGPVAAAIAMALHAHMSEIHDEEETVMTIKRVARVYSPWSSKIYGMRQPLR